MKIKAKRLVLITLLVQILLDVIHCEEEEESSTPSFWCWTKPASAKDQKNWNPKIGGGNWGFCSDPAAALNEQVDY